MNRTNLEMQTMHFDRVCTKPFTTSTSVLLQTKGEVLQTLPRNCFHWLSGRLEGLCHIRGHKQIICLA